ncbi:MAG TPA: ABC transporter substrate-binding protein [Chloroflexota bacterium]|nr:ABC transporter substrate-binding protein [Chloroflexota bacterium]
MNKTHRALGAWITGAALLLAACGGSAAPASTASSASPTAASPATGSAAAKPASSAAAKPAGSAAATAGSWEDLVAAAKKEGTVNVALPAGLPGVGDVFAKAFGDQYGIKFQYTTEQTPQPRIEQEEAANKVTTDVLISGASEFLTLYKENYLAPLKPILLKPDVADPSKWADGKLLWADKPQQYMLMTSEWVHIDLMVNSDIVKPDSITSWKDLLKPEFKDKMVAQQYAVGAGGATARMLLENFGPDFVKSIYKDQNTLVTRDARQVVQEMANGSHPVGLAILPNQAETFIKQGIHLVRVFPPDGRLNVSGGSGMPKMVKNAPHPNAAAVFINWFSSQEGQTAYAKQSLEASRRVDVNVPEVPDYTKPKPGYDYRNQYDEDYYVNTSPKMLKELEDLLGR